MLGVSILSNELRESHVSPLETEVTYDGLVTTTFVGWGEGLHSLVIISLPKNQNPTLSYN